MRVPFQETVDFRWLTIFVNAKEANIEIVAGILKVIRVAAKKSHLLFRREGEPHIIIALVTI